MKIYPNFDSAIRAVGEAMRRSAYEVQGTRWQSSDVSNKPDMRMREILNTSFQVSLGWHENLNHYKDDIKPNFPWADDHFEERVSGTPLNPGAQWRNWPWALSADKFRTEGEQFSHTYMERYWPKHAGVKNNVGGPEGIRYDVGDLDDVVNHLLGDPLSRQAYLPVWFPEDTGVVHGERVPCSLGYHWIQRNGYLHTTYYIRSCDFVRHFRDDLYLTIRLTLWLLNQLREREKTQGDYPSVKAAIQDSDWQQVKTGLFTFHCVSMHMFVNDWNRIYGAAASKDPK